MEIINENNGNEKRDNDKYSYYGCRYDEKWESRHRMSKVFIGVVVVIAGALLLMRQTGSEIPKWIFSWPMLLILIGIASGIKHAFKRVHSYIFLLLGALFLADKIYGGFELKPYVWPIAIIIVGFFIIFKPRRKHWKKWHHAHAHGNEYGWQHCHEKKKHDMNSEDYIEANAVFGTVTRNIISKNFKGGEINASFGGSGD